VPKEGKRLVIDANITCAASERESIDARPKSCRDFLNNIVEETKHIIVLTEAIRAEQHKHPSKFGEKWLRTMIAKKRVCWIDAPADEVLRRKVEQTATTPNRLIYIQEDILLIEAALNADKIILSMDEEVKVCFHHAAQTVRILRDIGWINPCRSDQTLDDAVIIWLQNGAEIEGKRLLGYRREDSAN